jgi:NAD(P)H-dependent FMN reductase
MPNLNLTAIVGSLRHDSVNGAIARAAVANIPDGVELNLYSVADLPFYNGDEEAAGPPGAVVALTEQVAGSDGLVFFSPEYNSSLPAVVKNAIDWLSRPPRAYEGTPVSLVTATPGGRAGLGVRSHFGDIMAHQPVRLFEPMGIGSYGEKVTDGELTDEATTAELVDFLQRFTEFCQAGE